MEEEERIQDLIDYKILDTPPEIELDELAKIASLIIGTPISLVTMIDKNRQWFKSNIGLDTAETTREDSFCQHSFHKPKEVLVVNDSHEDIRFKNNPLVTGNPNIRFYAGAPLETPSGNVLGTLCVIDTKPRSITENQKEALQLLAKKAMDHLNSRKTIYQQQETIEKSAQKLKRIIDLAPGVVFQFKMNRKKEYFFDFISKGIENFHPDLIYDEIKAIPHKLLNYIHPSDLLLFKKNIVRSSQKQETWSVVFRIVGKANRITWYKGKANPEKLPNGDIVWYGTFQNISNQIEYENVLEEIAFDISHVLRRPVTSLLGLTSLFEMDEEISRKELNEYLHNIHLVSEELDDFTRRLNKTYENKKKVYNLDLQKLEL
ncbi:GAF domain-containing protein [Autumnicola musiva]|uniref:histidine kinase n=1 Tax=Autumnicola musiva TaxID=3075589 RepID=A0ABU3DBC9_9FLAO|nr:GAF domain-containing protein [Zunongwangia sp. F117]MDT0678665.1 GAF domain-containing protein [Zunongwangia sp. F117]